jgi:serine/threonine protein kinase
MPAVVEVRQWCPGCEAIYRLRYAFCPVDGSPLVPAVGDPQLGQRLDDTWELVSLIAEGATSRVYDALGPEGPVAVKVVFGDVAADEATRERIVGAARAWARLSHPNIVPLLEVLDPRPGVPALIMRRIQGPSLAEWMRDADPADRAGRLGIAADIATGLAHAHAHGLYHGDLKPQNVLLAPEPTLLDFGLSRPPRARTRDAAPVPGTPGWMAPEQAAGSPLGTAGDLFSLGLLVFALVAGRAPYDGDAAERDLSAATRDAPSLASMAGEVDPELDQLVRDLLARDPARRPRSTEAVAERLLRLAERARARS